MTNVRTLQEYHLIVCTLIRIKLNKYLQEHKINIAFKEDKMEPFFFDINSIFFQRWKYLITRPPDSYSVPERGRRINVMDF
ncbi:hypothetical protein CHS0354_037752 [Potamilus streckersoni]|uniref:Uncharacterized protein n=1 Tax=Potamilus streckersoni TaxID=2493646 RepID=A0AAE0T3E7_9BIVA|nr:hypothetical protein CHS0354_037752 [Potamilus streckersoni]